MITSVCTIDLRMLWTAGIAMKVLSVDHNGQNGEGGSKMKARDGDAYPHLS